MDSSKGKIRQLTSQYIEPHQQGLEWFPMLRLRQRVKITQPEWPSYLSVTRPALVKARNYLNSYNLS